MALVLENVATYHSVLALPAGKPGRACDLRGRDDFARR